MKTTSYICDICKKSVSEKDLITIKMSVSNIRFETDSQYGPTSTQSSDICKDCLKKKGFTITEVTAENKEDIVKQNEKALRDKLLDILEDLDVCFTDHDHSY